MNEETSAGGKSSIFASSDYRPLNLCSVMLVRRQCSVVVNPVGAEFVDRPQTSQSLFASEHFIRAKDQPLPINARADRLVLFRKKEKSVKPAVAVVTASDKENHYDRPLLSFGKNFS
jgi:hypothetical protein